MKPGSSLPDIAVVIPLYNGARWIEATLNSVLEQTHPPREVIVVDDGSSDGSPAIASGFPGVRVCRREGRGAGGGAGPARRSGQLQTSAPLLAFLDQDDLWHPDHLRLLATALALDDDAPAAVCETRNFKDGSAPAFDAPGMAVEPVNPWDSYPDGFTMTSSGVLIRRTALERVGGWTEEHSPSDFYMWLRLSERRLLVLNRCASAARRLHDSGQYKRLMTEETVSFLSRRTQAAVAATHHREAARPEEAVAIGRLRDLAQALEGVILGIVEQDGRLITDAANHMERALAQEPYERSDRAFRKLLSFAKRLANTPRDRGAQLAFMIGSWPRSAPRTGRELRRRVLPFISGRNLARGLVQRPFSPHRWRLLAAVSTERLSRLFPES